MSKLRILFLESFYGGSHRAFADGFKAHSRHTVDLLTLPARFWKWRMRGAALQLLKNIPEPAAYQLVIATSLIDAALLKALWPGPCPPVLLYFHENQLLYPLAHGEKRDFHYGFSNITSCLAADQVLFNSRYHAEAFFEELPGFIRHLPDFKPLWVPDLIKERSRVLYPGIEVPDSTAGPGKTGAADDRGPVILWNHRWEHDKNPEAFFNALFRIKENGRRFRLIVAGEQFQNSPAVFERARTELKEEIIHFGYIENRQEYFRVVARADIVVSTSRQENFGLSMVESMAMGCMPIAPRRLSYPEIIPPEFHKNSLYEHDEDLPGVLSRAIADYRPSYQAGLKESMRRFYWSALIKTYDQLCEEAAGSCRGG